jgi:SARP family transcriptional regulator, regulator of embCAB operon
MEFRVLGPLGVSADGVEGAPSAPKLRKVLSLLLLHADEVVPVASILKELWDDEPPRSGLTTLQTYVLHLRKLLASLARCPSEEIAREVLVTATGGYTLRVGMARLDLCDFQDHLMEGQKMRGAGQDVQAVHHLRSALELWRGPALADVPAGRLLESKVRELEEWRLVALEFLIEAELQLGMHREVVAKLAGLAVENPLHEGLHRQYMVALHLAGRRAQALEVFHRLRSTLVRELGLEPAPHLQRLQQAILTGEADVRDIPAHRHDGIATVRGHRSAGVC